MVTAFTGILNLFRDFGLPRRPCSETSDGSTSFDAVLDQSSGGSGPGVLCGVFAPLLLVRIYHEPRLLRISIVLSLGFLFYAAGIQHSALLQRHLRFTALAVINVVALVVAGAVAIGMAALGFGYWALVWQTVTVPLAVTAGVWIATGWLPGKPRRGAGVLSMMKFGGTLTLNGIIVYIGYNLDKVLLGRFWGAEDLGLYGRGYQLISIPTDNLNQSVGEVAFSAMSRVQN